MNTVVADTDRALIEAAVADAPALTSDQITELRQALRPAGLMPRSPAPSPDSGAAVELGRAA